MPVLIVVEGPHAGTQLELDAEVTIGRSSTCDLVVEDVNVSRRHAQLLLERGDGFVVDLGSRNGTALNGAKIAGKTKLQPGDRIQVGPMVLAYDPDPVRVFAEPSTGPLRTGTPPPPESTDAPAPSVLRRIFATVTRAASPAGCIRLAVESAVSVLDAERGVAVSFPDGSGVDISCFVGGLFSIPDAFEAPLRNKQWVCDSAQAAAPIDLPDGRQGAVVVRRPVKPFSEADLALLLDISRLAALIAAGGQARQPLLAAAFPLVLWQERPALLSSAFKRCLERSGQAARHSSPLLLIGEPATGRDELALTVHQLGKRASGPFIAWRQPAADPLAPGRLPSADSIVQALQRAEGGTLYLGDIFGWSTALAELWVGELERFRPPLSAGDPRLPSPVRIIAGSSVSLAKLSTSGKLPRELLSRFDGERIDVPPLRKRKGDLPLLVERLSAAAGQRLGRAVPKFSPAAIKALTDYPWPGNLAELQVCTEWALFACGAESQVQLWDLPPQVRAGDARGREKLQPLAEMVGALERTAIVEALRESGFKKIHAAAALGISRPTLDKKIAEYQIRLRP